MNDLIGRLVQKASGTDIIKLKFLNRLDEGQVTRFENPTSHVCVYFCAYAPKTRKVFIGLHKKSGLWLFNGGHMNPDEQPVDSVIREAKEEWGMTLEKATIPDPQLVTLTEIEHPERQICEWHYDLWFFLPMDESAFHPNPSHLETEFSEFGWKPYDVAKTLFTDPNSKEALAYIWESGATSFFPS